MRSSHLTALAFGVVLAAAVPVRAITVTFDAGSGIATQYSENGILVKPDVAGFYVILGDNNGDSSPDLENHPGCCSTPYRFTYNGGAVFSVARWDFTLNSGTHTFTSSSGATITPGGSGVVTAPAGFTGITYFTWHAPGSDQTQTAVMDNLVFCPGDCNDANVCTDDACDPGAPGADVNGCTHTPNAASCDDTIFCNGADTCSGGTCSQHVGDPCVTGTECNNVCHEDTHTCATPSTTPCTDDGNVCTDDHCDGAGSCIHPNNTAPCNDGTFCNGADTCSGGSCIVHAGNPCAAGPECDNFCNEGAQNCFSTATTPCTSDGNVCTDDHCDGGGFCIHSPNAASCDDNNACTLNDHCSGSSCVGTQRNCDDHNTCTQDSCDQIAGCVNDPAPLNGTSCDDNNTCTSNDTCNNGTCAGTQTGNCDDGNPCTVDGCDPQGGCTHDPAPLNGFGCDDMNSCTNNDTCQDGVCRGTLGEPDSDGDGYCDRVETAAGCNPHDAAEIPSQPATFGGSNRTIGSVILTYAAPALAKPSVATDPSCATAGTCGAFGFCSAGPVGNPCTSDADCVQPPNTCRMVVNFANIPDVALIYAKLNRTVVTPMFSLPTHGCSRKIDIPIDPARLSNKLKLKASATVGGRFRKDSDRFKYLH